MSIKTQIRIGESMTIESLCQESHAIAKEKGWWEEDRNIGEVMMNISSEVSEAWEEWRDGHKLDEIYFNESKPEKPEGVPIELADVVIRIADLCEAKGINLGYAVFLKMNYNRRRAYRHGGKLA